MNYLKLNLALGGTECIIYKNHIASFAQSTTDTKHTTILLVGGDHKVTVKENYEEVKRLLDIDKKTSSGTDI